MTEVTNELMYEVLKAIKARLGTMDDRIRDVNQQLIAIRGYLRSVHTDVGNLYESMATVDNRPTRIERRLDIIDIPIA